MQFRKSHKRLSSDIEAIFDNAVTPAPERRSTFRSVRSRRPGQPSLWKRLLRSCVSSSNPDSEQFRPAVPSEPSQLVEIHQKTKRASYIPRHAEASFASSATPLKARDPERKMRQSQIYQQAFLAESDGASKMKARHIGLSFEDVPEEPASKKTD